VALHARREIIAPVSRYALAVMRNRVFHPLFPTSREASEAVASTQAAEGHLVHLDARITYRKYSPYLNKLSLFWPRIQSCLTGNATVFSLF
jgi:hypothetical protein